MTDKIKIGISSCLLGINVRYDGGNRANHYLRDTLGQFIELVHVCPEIESGLPVPRETMHLLDDPDAPRLVTKVTNIDHTDRIAQWAKTKLLKLEKAGLCGFVFKARSPSCGMRDVKIISRSGASCRKGPGLFYKAFKEHFPFLPLEDEERLCIESIRENFIERMFLHHRWRKFTDLDGSIDGLVQFHIEQELLVMSHSIEHLMKLSTLVAAGMKRKRSLLVQKYYQILMDGMKFQATITKHTNVLRHVMGYFKRRLSDAEKRELLEVVKQYHKGLAPLVIPLTLVRHYARKYGDSYLWRQCYLTPHPLETMLKNHV